MSSDQMKKMLMLVESCSCESNKEELDESAAMSAEELAHVSDEALDNAYHYGRSSPGNSFGWQANVKSAEFAKQAIEAGETDIEAISDAIHKGWNVTAKAFVSNPDQFGDTEKLRAAGKLEAKLAQREKLMNINYAQLPEDEKEKDRVVARALFKAIKGDELSENVGGSDYGQKIKEYFGKIGDHGDEGYEYLDKHAPLWSKLFDYADGDIDAIVATEKPEVLKQAADELEMVVSDLESGIYESDFAAFLESVREMAGGQFDELEEDYKVKDYKGDGTLGGPQPKPYKGDGTFGGPRPKPYRGEPEPKKKSPPKPAVDKGPEHKEPVIAPKFLESQSTEDAEFQEFMESLNRIVRK